MAAAATAGVKGEESSGGLEDMQSIEVALPSGYRNNNGLGGGVVAGGGLAAP